MIEITQQKPVKIDKAVGSWENRIKTTINKALQGRVVSGDLGTIMLSDISDYIRLINMIRDNKINKAAYFADDMDTAARDLIPSVIYDWLMDQR